MAATTALLFCVEPGLLFRQTVLALRSLGKFAPDFLAQAELWAIAPRAEFALTAADADVLRSLGARYCNKPLNRTGFEYGHINKAFAAAWVEANSAAQTIVFCDSDTVFLGEPARLCASAPAIGVRPVDRRGIGAGTPSDPAWSYWQALIDRYGLDGAPRVRTVVDRASIFPYFNAGLVVASKRLGLMHQWQRRVEHLLDLNLVPPRPQHLDQVALALVIAEAGEQWSDLGPAYNYPLPWRPLMPPEAAQMRTDELIHVHYHRWFQSRGFLERLTPPLDGPALQWLRAQLPLHPQIDVLYTRGLAE